MEQRYKDGRKTRVPRGLVMMFSQEMLSPALASCNPGRGKLSVEEEILDYKCGIQEISSKE